MLNNKTLWHSGCKGTMEIVEEGKEDRYGEKYKYNYIKLKCPCFEEKGFALISDNTFGANDQTLEDLKKEKERSFQGNFKDNKCQFFHRGHRPGFEKECLCGCQQEIV